jgi:cytochrome P450
MLTRYGDCAEVLASRHFAMRGIQDFLRSQLGAGPAFHFVSRRFHFLDPPDHTRIRSLTTKAFSARQVLAMRPQILRLAAGLLDNSGPRFDLIKTLAHPLPSMVISEMLGTPLADRDQLSAWTGPITRIQGDVQIEAGLLAEADSAAAGFMTYVRALIRSGGRSRARIF